MIRLDDAPILTPEEMRAAEAAHGDPAALMEIAGRGVADAVRRLAGGSEALILCGPGNNGGDGYVAACMLRESGYPVRVAALCEPRTPLAIAARERWGGPIAFYADGGDIARQPNPWAAGEPAPAAVLVDALFGTGAHGSRDDPDWAEDLAPLFVAARLRIAVDLPTGVDPSGRPTVRHDDFDADVTLALGALKPVHVGPSATRRCGAIRLIDLGLDTVACRLRVAARPRLPEPTGDSHKFSRGMVAVIAGAMPGAALLASTAAARAGAGYVTLCGDAPAGPAAIVRRPLAENALSDERLGVIVVGPGLGRDRRAREWLEKAWAQSFKTLVIDGDALHLLDRDLLSRQRNGPIVMTPHIGEYHALQRNLDLDLNDAAFPQEAAAVRRIAPGLSAVLVRKGPTTIITDGRDTRVTEPGSAWLSTAGSGDVLAGAIAASLAAVRGGSTVEAAAAGVRLHEQAARLCGRSFIADDLAAALSRVR